METPANRKLLMAEDNAINRKRVDLLFQRHGITLNFANNGEDAFNYVLNDSFDLILTGNEMPILGGVTATQKIKEALGEQAPLIIALTAHALEGEREEFLNQGFDEYLGKPIKMEELNERVRELL